MEVKTETRGPSSEKKIFQDLAGNGFTKFQFGFIVLGSHFLALPPVVNSFYSTIIKGTS